MQDGDFLHELMFDALLDDKQGMVEALIDSNQLNLDEFVTRDRLKDLYDKVCDCRSSYVEISQLVRCSE